MPELTKLRIDSWPAVFSMPQIISYQYDIHKRDQQAKSSGHSYNRRDAPFFTQQVKNVGREDENKDFLKLPTLILNTNC